MNLMQAADMPFWMAAPETATASVVDPAPETVTYRCACGFTLDEARGEPT